MKKNNMMNVTLIIRNGYVEVETPNTEQIIRLEAYRKRFEELTVLDTQTDSIESYTYRGGYPVRTDRVSLPFYRLVKEALRRWKEQATVVYKQAHIMQTAKGTHGDAPVEPVRVEVCTGEIPVYGTPTGQHGPYEWKPRNWKTFGVVTDPDIRKLVTMKARVFPRYARKAHAGYKPGDFIGLGGPDAKLFRDNPNAVRFIRENTAMKVQFRVQPV